MYGAAQQEQEQVDQERCVPLALARPGKGLLAQVVDSSLPQEQEQVDQKGCVHFGDLLITLAAHAEAAWGLAYVAWQKMS